VDERAFWENLEEWEEYYEIKYWPAERRPNNKHLETRIKNGIPKECGSKGREEDWAPAITFLMMKTEAKARGFDAEKLGRKTKRVGLCKRIFQSQYRDVVIADCVLVELYKKWCVVGGETHGPGLCKAGCGRKVPTYGQKRFCSPRCKYRASKTRMGQGVSELKNTNYGPTLTLGTFRASRGGNL